MPNESHESFRDTTDVESTGRQCQKTNNDVIALPPAGTAFPSPPRIAKSSITRQDTDVEIETEVVPPGMAYFFNDNKRICSTFYIFIKLI